MLLIFKDKIMKFYGIIALAALGLAACSDDDTVVVPTPAPPVLDGETPPNPPLTDQPITDVKPAQ